jgi:hypothetical protein
MNINLKLFMIWECYGGLKLCLDHNIDNLDTKRSSFSVRLVQY